jgi:C1A family cysteine protease
MNEHGLGAIQSPPDERDLVITSLITERLAAVVLPSRYRVPTPAPILDQGSTPQCVAYSTARMQMWNDRTDYVPHRWFNFNEAAFFRAIGGTADGAFLRAALDRLVKVGYPVESTTPNPYAHKIRRYYAVPKTVHDMKRAIFHFGPVVAAFPWFNSWMAPVNGVLPRPDYAIGGHAIDIEAWDDAKRAFLLPNSWSTRWGVQGTCWMPYAYFTQACWEAWKVVDA